MSQIITVATEIKNFKPLTRAYEALGYKKVSGSEKEFTIQKGRVSITAKKSGEFYSLVGDSDYIGANRKDGNIVELQNEYNKEEALAWAKYEGRTILKITGNATKGYDIEVSG